MIEVSVILSSLNSNLSVGTSEVSVNFTDSASVLAKIPLVIFVFKIIVSSSSFLVSSSPENNNSATVSPALTTNCGEITYF